MLSIQNLGKTYPNGVHALQDVSLDVPAGMFGLLGPNGAGKSSLMRTIATLQLPDQGSIRFDDLDVLAEPATLRARLGYLPQDFGVYPGVSGWDLLMHFATLKGIPASARRSTVSDMLNLVHLYDKRNKAVSTYSGGMLRRFGIAQALLGTPSLIIVDEPTAGLDPKERHRFNNLLAKIGENVVVILSTHIVEDVWDLCPRMAVMNSGQIVAHGSPHALTSQLRGKLWRKEIGRNDLAKVKAQHRLILSRYVSGALVVDVLADAQPNGFSPVEPLLEHLYFSIIGAED
ncbi:ABC transporter ATP-binding protein [Peristeroidobacter soli]|uniref:ABC transporter ATP-binding protein n=1 Tax=Peristeroidobacter soli TaxID=2497877 RepID=UPI00101BA7AA|nr:ABC transporter ATP-binding protein [Peristeroidobacter soli]